ncbi:hypothetical protein ANN_11180 [Periplaneta americana]|uniref:DDE-1 domain-containing protein n=1 Tax=Periplaneta americana TaxID=6978 RepID=A0ABQ8T4A5_PERAM|nr:hypothetical protein ANN_11180 [Periplaneta americana]
MSRDKVSRRKVHRENVFRQKSVIVNQFENNIPGKTWADMFLKRHKQELSQRFCSNITRVRAVLDEETIQSFFTHFKKEIEGVPAHLIYKYDETNLVDDPGNKKVLMKHSCKYPQAIKNSTKAAVSIMICGNAAGDVLPPYVNYKSEHLWTTWTEGGPAHTRYNSSHSGWFDTNSFEDSWPGRIKSTNCMARCGLSWKWPEKEDFIFYPNKDITFPISPPSKMSTKMALYRVPQLEDRWGKPLFHNICDFLSMVIMKTYINFRLTVCPTCPKGQYVPIILLTQNNETPQRFVTGCEVRAARWPVERSCRGYNSPCRAFFLLRESLFPRSFCNFKFFSCPERPTVQTCGRHPEKTLDTLLLTTQVSDSLLSPNKGISAYAISMPY